MLYHLSLSINVYSARLRIYTIQGQLLCMCSTLSMYKTRRTEFSVEPITNDVVCSHVHLRVTSDIPFRIPNGKEIVRAHTGDM